MKELKKNERARMDHAAGRIGDSRKQATAHRRREPTKATAPFHTVWSDVACPMTSTFLGSRYLVTFVDEYTRYSVVYPMRNKSEVAEKFGQYLKFVRLVSKRLGEDFQIHRLKSDNGGEYVSAEFKRLIDNNDIVHLTTVPETPEMNSIAESFNRVLFRIANKMMVAACLATPFWGFAVNYANYVRNRTPIASLEFRSPYEILFGELPKLNNVRVFGCDAYVHDHAEKKFGSKAHKGIFVGVAPEDDRWLIFHPESRTVKSEKHVEFVEDLGARRNHLREYDDMEESHDVDALSVPIQHFEKDFDAQVRRLSVRRLFSGPQDLRAAPMDFDLLSRAGAEDEGLEMPKSAGEMMGGEKDDGDVVEEDPEILGQGDGTNGFGIDSGPLSDHQLAEAQRRNSAERTAQWQVRPVRLRAVGQVQKLSEGDKTFLDLAEREDFPIRYLQHNPKSGIGMSSTKQERRLQRLFDLDLHELI